MTPCRPRVGIPISRGPDNKSPVGMVYGLQTPIPSNIDDGSQIGILQCDQCNPLSTINQKGSTGPYVVSNKNAGVL